MVQDIVIATYNIGHATNRQVKLDFDEIAKWADVINFQEAGDRGRPIADWAETNGWETYFGDGSRGAEYTPIIWRKGVHVTAKHTTPATPPTYVGGQGAGGPMIGAKVVNRIKIGRGRKALHVINNHFTPSATVHRYSNVDARRKQYAKQADALVGVVRRRFWGKAVAVGDFNAPDTFDLLAPLRRRMTQRNNLPTHGPRVIDHIWVEHGVIINKIWTKRLSSDHKALFVRIVRP